MTRTVSQWLTKLVTVYELNVPMIFPVGHEHGRSLVGPSASSAAFFQLAEQTGVEIIRAACGWL